MTKTTRNVVVGMAIAMGTAGVPRAEAANGGLGTAGARVFMRVRTNSPVVAELIQEATARSATFRSLIDTIHASDGIATSTKATAATASGPVWPTSPRRGRTVSSGYRSIRARRTGISWDRSATNCATPSKDRQSDGHQQRSDVFFYERTGRRGTKSSFETDAAVEAGRAVRSEVRQPALMARSE